MTVCYRPGTDGEPAPGSHEHRGLALVAVLWMVAAFSIMVVGMSAVVLRETRSTSSTRQAVVLGALGTAAIQMVLQEMKAMPQPVARLSFKDVTFQNQLIRVEITPLTGLIDINNAPPSLLVKLLLVRGAVDADRALNVAKATLEMRALKDPRGAARGFESIEDWLNVPGVDYPLYARVKGVISADLFAVGSGRVNPMAAPPEVLLVLAGGNAEHARRIAAQRDHGAVGIDTTMLDAADIDSGTTERFRIAAWVPVQASADVSLRVSQTVDLSPIRRESVPWRIFHAQRQFENTRSKPGIQDS